MDINHMDVEEYLGCETIALVNTATSASTGDATEVEGAMIDMDGYLSGTVVIAVQTNLTATKTLTMALNIDSAATNTNVSTTTDVVIAAATTVATGADSSVETTYSFPVSYDILKVQSARYCHIDITPNLSQSNGDDNCAWSAVFIGLKRVMS